MPVERFLTGLPEARLTLPTFEPKDEQNPLVGLDDGLYRRECPMCCEKVRLIAVGTCPHSLCVVCAVRLRVKQKKRECEYCKSLSPQLAVTTQLDARTIVDVDTTPFVHWNHGMICETKSISHLCRDLARPFFCWYDGADFKSFKKLQAHLRGRFRRKLCELCVSHGGTKLLCEHYTYDSSYDFNKHKREGEPNLRPPIAPHPRCPWCRSDHFDQEALIDHFRQVHFECSICSASLVLAQEDPTPAMFPNVQELLLHQERQHYPCPYHDTCLMVCFKSPFDLQMHLSKTHNDSGGSLAKRGRGIQVTLQELQSAHEEMEPREGRGARRRPPAERPPERSPRERKNAQVLTLSKQNRDLLKRHVLWRFKKQISEEDRVVAGERLQEGIEQLPDDFQKNTIRLSQQMHDPRMTPTAMFDLVQHLVTVDAVLADVPPIDLSWRRLHVPTFCELIYLVVISYPLVGRRPAIEAALKDLVFDSGARTIRAAPKQLPVLPSAVPDSTDGIPAPFRSRVVIKDSFQKSLQLALKTLRHGCRVAVSRLSPSQQDILSNYAKESRLQLTPLHEVLSDAVGPRTCDQILALRADYFRAKMLQDEPLWVERCWHTFIDVGQEQRDLVADFLLMSEELPEPVSPESTNGPEEFPTLDGEPVTPRARMPERSKPDGCDFPSLGDSMPDAYKRVPRPKMRQVTTRTVSLAEFATKPKVVKRNMILTDDDETFPSLLSCQDAQLDRDKRVERTFKKMLAKKKPLPTPAVEPEFPSLGGDIIRRVPPVKAVPAVKAASPASRVVRVNPADSLGTVSLEPFSFPSLIGNTPAVSPTPGSAAVGRGFLNAHRPAGHPKPESSPKLRKADIPPLTAFPSLEDDCLPETTTKMCNFCGSRQRNAHVIRWETTARLNSVYQREANRILQHLAEHFEKAKEDGAQWIEAVDFDLGDGVLQVDIIDKFGNDSSLLLNKHYVTTQIWYSSPASGANYFEFDDTNSWTSLRNGKTIIEQVAEDLAALTERDIYVPYVRDQQNRHRKSEMDAIMRSRSLRSHLSAGILHEDERYSDLEEPPAQTVNLKDALLPHTYDTGGASRSLSHLAKVRNQKRSELLRSAFYRDLEFKSESESGLSDVADNHQESHSGSHFFAELDEQLQFRHSHSNSNSRTSSPENRPPPKRARTSVGVRTGERTQPCMICLCTDIDKPSSTNACSHVFCFECLVKWSEMTNKCPICKLEFSRIKSKAEGTARSIPVVRKDLLRHLRDEEDYYCLRCGSCERGDVLLLCDAVGCTRACHTYCVGLDSVPEDDWFCEHCLPYLSDMEAELMEADDETNQSTPVPTQQRPRQPRRRRLRALESSDNEQSPSSLPSPRSSTRTAFAANLRLPPTNSLFDRVRQHARAKEPSFRFGGQAVDIDALSSDTDVKPDQALRRLRNVFLMTALLESDAVESALLDVLAPYKVQLDQEIQAYVVEMLASELSLAEIPEDTCLRDLIGPFLVDARLSADVLEPVCAKVLSELLALLPKETSTMELLDEALTLGDGLVQQKGFYDPMLGMDEVQLNINNSIPLDEAVRLKKAQVKEKQRQMQLMQRWEKAREPLPAPTRRHGDVRVRGLTDIMVDKFNVDVEGRLLLEDAALRIVIGRKYGLLGRNGIGKSTFLSAVARKAIPGLAEELTIGCVEQEVTFGDDVTPLQAVMSVDVERCDLLNEAEELETRQDDQSGARLLAIYERLEFIDAHNAEAQAATILSGLGFNSENMNLPVRFLSGGWRMRVVLARALFAAPDLLLLDEPTNHLDLHAVAWLSDYVAHNVRTCIIVSHARHFLNEVCTDIIDYRDMKLMYYKGNYDDFERLRAERLTNQRKQYDAQMEKRAHIQKFIDRFRAKASKATLVQSRIKALNKLPMLDAVGQDPTTVFNFGDPEELPIPIMQVNDVSFNYGDNAPVLRDVNLSIDLDSRLAICGVNGSGKSTLLKLIVGLEEAKSGLILRNGRLRIGYFAQHHMDQLDLTFNAVQQLQAKFPEANMNDEAARNYLARFGLSGTLALEPLYVLSGGQKSRVVMALLAFPKPHILVLDEPTNHLDLDAVQALIVALNEFQGGVVVVSHDAHLLECLVDDVLHVEPKTQHVVRFRSTFSNYKKLLLKGVDIETSTEEDLIGL